MLYQRKTQVSSSYWYPVCVVEMDHSAADKDYKAVEFAKDKNGVGQVLLRSLRGASVRVSLLLRLISCVCVWLKGV